MPAQTQYLSYLNIDAFYCTLNLVCWLPNFLLSRQSQPDFFVVGFLIVYYSVSVLYCSIYCMSLYLAFLNDQALASCSSTAALTHVVVVLHILSTCYLLDTRQVAAFRQLCRVLLF